MKEELFSHAAPVFPVADVASTAKWYEEKLGFRISFLWEKPPTYGVLRRSENVSIHLAKADMEKVDRKAIHYIFVHDVDSVYAEFLEREAPLGGKPQGTDYQMKEFELCDPDGNKLVFGKSLVH